MSVPEWPSSLPQSFDADGMGGELHDNRIKSDMDIGPAKIRGRTTSGPEPFQASMTMTRTQVEALKTFCKDTLLGCALRFSFTGPYKSSESGELRFVNPPKWQIAGVNSYTRDEDIYKVTMDMEILP